MAAITPDGRQELVALYLVMFGRAPTTVQLAQMVIERENGSTLAQVATTLSAETDFALVAAKDADSFATYLTDALLAADTPASARAWSINWIVTQVQGTKTKAQVIAEAVQAIRATTNTNYTSSQTEMAADVASALNNIDNPVQPLVALGVTPADDSTRVNPERNIEISFGEAIKLGTGTVEIYRLDSAGQKVVHASFQVQTDTTHLSISGSKLTIDPGASLQANTEYFVTIEQGALQNLAGTQRYAGLSGYQFKTMTAAEVQLNTSGVTLESFLSFLGTHVARPAVTYAYVNQVGLSFDALLGLLGANSTSATATSLRASLLEHGLSASALGANTPASAGFSTTTTALTPNADTHNATSGADTLNALAGDDQVNGLAGNDAIQGAEGNDTLDGGRGRDWLDGGSDNDVLRAGSFATVVEGSTYYDMNSHSYVTSPSSYTFDDVNAEWLYGRAGNDSLYGGYGSDFLDGGDGDDLLEADHNTLYTANASSTERANMLNDTLYGGAGADTLKGGEGNDIYLYQGMPGTQEVVAGETISDTSGTDTLWALTSTDFSLLGGGTTTLGSMGLDQVLISSGESATFTAAQLAGSTIRINATGVVAAQFTVLGAVGNYDFSQLKFDAAGSNHAFHSGVDKVTLDFSTQTGSTLTGTSLSDTILTGAQNTIQAGAGNDWITYTPANGTAASLAVNGGEGTDTLQVITGSSAGTLQLGDGFLGGLTQVERVVFSGSRAVEVTLGAAANTAWSSGIVLSQEANAALTVRGEASQIAITALGSTGDDLLTGGTAHDTFSGGLGADLFVFKTADTDTTLGQVTDTVTDFRKAQGDSLNLGLQATATNFLKGSTYLNISDLLVQADLALNGTVHIVVGQVGNDTYVVTDEDGKGYTQVIRLTGITLEDIEASNFVNG